METFKRFVARGEVLLLLGFLAIAAMVVAGLKLNFARGDWAAWVQAVGSVAALAVAVFVMSRQNTHSRTLLIESDLKAQRRRAKAVMVLINRAHKQLTFFIRTLQNSAAAGDDGEIEKFFGVSRPIAMETRQHLVGVPIHELGDAELASGVLLLMEGLAHYSQAADECVGRTDKSSFVAILLPTITRKVDKGLESFVQGVSNLG